jgi:deoxyadenosine/deoxycytidine kinase
LRLLQRTIGASGKWVVVQEPVEQWQKIGGKHNLLEAYYSNQERYAFSFQTNCVLSRIRGLQEVLRSVPAETEVIVLERCWHSDRNTFGEMLHRQSKISDLEWALYDEWFQFAVENAPFIDGYVYLEAKSETCMSRLRKRDRTEEVGVTEAYQQELIACHETWLSSLPEQDRVCRVPVDGDFVDDADRGTRVVSSIEDFISGLQAMRF